MKNESAVAGVQITHPRKKMFSKPAVSKIEVARYYEMIFPRMRAEAAERPLMLMRCPQGNSTRCFFQKHYEGNAPVPTLKLKEESGSAGAYMYLKTVKDLVRLVQLNAIEFHAWGSRVKAVETPDRIIFDLDPGSASDTKLVLEVALLLKKILDGLDLRSFPRISGGKGVHLVVPIKPRYSWDEVRSASEAIAMLAAARDERITLNSRKAARKNKLFLDFLRNGRGATAIVNYSLRARPGAPIAVPIGWQDLKRVRSFNFLNISNIEKWLAKRRADPWEEIAGMRQSLPGGLFD